MSAREVVPPIPEMCPMCKRAEPLVLHGEFTRRSGEKADTWTCDNPWHSRAGEVVPPILGAEEVAAMPSYLSEAASRSLRASHEALRAERDYYQRVYRELVERHQAELAEVRAENLRLREELTPRQKIPGWPIPNLPKSGV